MTTTTTTLVTPAVTLQPAEITVTSAKKLTGAEKTIATAFAHWANVSDQADDATLLLAIHLIVADSVSARRASEIATEALGTNRGWSKDKVTAVRWTAPIWQFAVSPDRPADDHFTEDGEPVSVASLISEVRTICSVIGSGRVRDAIASVDEPSVVAYVSALRDARDAKALGAENEAPADEAEQADEAEAEGKPGKTDADRIQAVLNTLSGIEGDDTLADALPALIDAVSALVAKVA